MAAGDILIRWASESSAAVRDMGKVERALKDTMSSGEKWSRRWATASDIALKAGTAMAGAIAVEAVRAGRAAMRQEQALAGLSAVYKDQAGAMQEWAASMSDAGLSTTDAAAGVTKLGGAMKSAGMDLDEVTARAPELVEIATQLSQVYGVDVTQAIEAMGGAFRGEYDSAQTMNIAISDAKVKAELAKEGWDKLTGAAYEQKRALVVNRLLLEGTKDAQEAAGAGAETTAARFKKFQAQLDNIEASLGSALLPLMNDLADVLENVTDAAEENPDAVREWAGIIAGIAGALLVLGTASKAVTVIQGVAGALKAFPKAGAIGVAVGGIITLKQVLKDVDEQSDITLRSLTAFWSMPDIGANLRLWTEPFEDLMAWMQSFETSGVWRGMRLGLAQVTDALGITQNRYEELKLEFSDPIQAQITAANADALNAAARAENALRRVADGRYRATIDAAEDKARAAARAAQRAIDSVQQGRPARIDGDGSPARTEADRTKTYIDGLGATLSIRAKVIGLQAALSAASPVLGRSAGYAATPPETLRIDKVEIIMRETPRDPLTFARDVRAALTSDEVRSGRVKVAR